MIRDSAIDRARRPTDEIVSDLRGIVGSRKLARGRSGATRCST